MRKRYSQEERQHVLSMYASGNYSVQELLAANHIARSTLYRWIKEQQNANNKYAFTAQDFYNMKRRIKHMEQVISALQESSCSPNAPLSEKLREMVRLSPSYSVRVLCDAFNVPKGTYYNHSRRSKGDNAWFIVRRAKLKEKIQEIYDDHYQIYGGDKIAAILRRQGISVSDKMVYELMRELNIRSIRSSSKAIYNKLNGTFSNKVRRNFVADEPNLMWASDVTYFKVKDNSYYICAILDLFSRKVVAYTIGRNNTTALVKQTIRAAYNLRKPQPGLIFHSDRGSNYQSNTIRKYLKELKIEQSFSKAGSPRDNAVLESFFATLKREELYRRFYRSEKEFRKCVDNYIQFYNSKRPIKLLKYKSPNQKETEYFDRINILSR